MVEPGDPRGQPNATENEQVLVVLGELNDRFVRMQADDGLRGAAVQRIDRYRGGPHHCSLDQGRRDTAAVVRVQQAAGSKRDRDASALRAPADGESVCLTSRVMDGEGAAR